MNLSNCKFRWLLVFNLLTIKNNFCSDLQVRSTFSDWSGGGQYSIDVKNTTNSPITSWTVEFDLSNGQRISDLWNANYTVSGNHVIVKNPSWFQNLAVNATANFGFVFSAGGSKTLSNLKAYTGSVVPPDPDPTTTVSLQSTFALNCDWTTGYQAQVTIKNTSTKKIDNWTLEFDLESGQTITDLWNGIQTITNNHVVVKNPASTTVDVNGTVVIGFIIKGAGARKVNNLKATSTTSTTPPSPEPTGTKFVGYFPNWFLYAKPYIQSFEAKDIQANLLTHVNYAFAKPYTTDANRNVINYKVSLFDPWADIQYNGSGHFGQLIQLKQQYPNLKTLIAIGGWTVLNEGFPAAKFSVIAANANYRKDFINSLIDLIVTYEFDGADIDWEYPGHVGNGGKPEDKQNFTTLMKELNAAFKNEQALATVYSQKGKTPKKELLLTIAGPAGNQNIANMELSIVKDYVDWINLMTYDFHGSWDTITNHNAPLNAPAQGDPLFNVKSAVDQYLNLGVPANKIVLGMPLYGRSFAQVQSNTDGLFAPFNGAGDGTDPNEAGMLLYHDIKSRFIPTYTKYYDSQAQVPYLFNKTTKQFISYDDEQSLKLKCDYVKSQKLAGAMFWSLAKEQSQWDLIAKVKSELATS